MTSRFYKTYSRKGGDGTSKFDEVFANKKTMSTKWGETTYRAKVTSKRPGLAVDKSELSKRSRLTVDDSSEDPFGFDSDDESKPKPVSSRSSGGGSGGGGGQNRLSPARAERTPSLTLEPNSRVSQPASVEAVAPSRGSSGLGSDRSSHRVPEDPSLIFSTSSVGLSHTSAPSWLPDDSSDRHMNWYKNASESDRRPHAQTTTLRSETLGSRQDAWDLLVGLQSSSISTPAPPEAPAPREPFSWALASRATTSTTTSTNTSTNTSGSGVPAERDRRPDARQELWERRPDARQEPWDRRPDARQEPLEPTETLEQEDHSQSYSALQRSSNNCRTYRRPNKGKPSGTDALEAAGRAVVVTGTAGSEVTQALHAGRGGQTGRTRDFTVLHPSSLSACNVTIQDQIDRSVDLTSDLGSGGGAVATGVTTVVDPGEAGRLRKKGEIPTTKPASKSKPAQSKSKKGDSRLDLFGFDDADAPGDDPNDPLANFGSSYKIQYFGFDDLSESDEDEDVDSPAAQRRRERKRAKAAALAATTSTVSTTTTVPTATAVAMSTSVIQTVPREMTDRLTSSSRIDIMEERLASSRAQPTPQERIREGSRKIFGPKKSPTKAVYNARHWNQQQEEELPPLPPPSRSQTKPASGGSSSSSSSAKDSNPHKDDGLFKAPPPPPKVIKSVTIPTVPYQDMVTALKCRKEHKELFTVVQHVKHFNDVVEFGENQEFTDDFEYLATGLKTGEPLNTRCLSVISLASRCATPSFRMHLRARGKVAQVFKTLSDAPQHPNLALCTASLMYILSRDRLNMDLDRACLELMIRLLELEQDGTARVQLTAKEMAKVKEKIRKLCETVHNKHLDLENITTGHLAMETLLSLTSKRAGDWFKEELRLLGGLDHIVDKVKECVENLSEEEDKEKLVASLWGSERCLRVLESVTVHNPENQSYLIAYKDSQLIVSSAKALRHCEEMIQRYSREVNCVAATPLPYCSNSNVGKAVEDCMRAIIGVLLNLTHDNEWGSTKTGEQEDLIITALNCVLRVPQYLPQEQRFDIRVLGLGLLINLVEYSARNRHCLVEMQMDGHAPFTSVLVGEKEELATDTPLSAIAALVQLFLQREQAAILAEAQTDDLISEAPKPQDQSGEWQENDGEIQWVAADNSNDNNDNNATKENDKKKEEEEEELDLNKALQHAGKHMEDSIVASYTALLLGCLCQESPMNVTTVRENLPKGDFSIMTEMLKKFLNFMNLTCDGATAGQKSISRVIDYLEHC
ncbi:wings apart-like protein homolog [Alosa sapidissima]|uniref:wings apart-like protein homolog n=1 Tax=Alosa sapidissima TaxID=34773 RepID=UPI001C08F239|nr:wings apart-like protein homolog [Alosa sapidissima]XP_041941934.1 wings apart-like protein homolog [Alosa sapidissima]